MIETFLLAIFFVLLLAVVNTITDGINAAVDASVAKPQVVKPQQTPKAVNQWIEPWLE